MNILIADDHHLILEGLEQAIQKQYPDAELSLAIKKQELDGILAMKEIDLLLLDVKFGTDNAKLFLPNIKEAFPELKILIVSSVSDYLSVDLLRNQGIDGYVLKSDSLVEVLSAVRAILDGNTYFSSSLPQVSESSLEIILTPREKSVLNLILCEFSTKEIAEELDVSVKTVEMHRANLFSKVGVKNSTGLVKKAILLGLLDE